MRVFAFILFIICAIWGAIALAGGKARETRIGGALVAVAALLALAYTI